MGRHKGSVSGIIEKVGITIHKEAAENKPTPLPEECCDNCGVYVFGWCRRYPTSSTKNPSYWCGEWREKKKK
jgi:hypothetical protein